MLIRTGKVVGIVAAIVMSVGICAWAAEEKTMTPLDVPMIGDMEALQPGEDAYDFSVKDVDGNQYEFKAAGGGARMLVFWSIFCEPCRAEMPLIEALYQKHKADGFDVISVALDGDLADNIKKFADKGGYTFKVLLDEESEDGSLVVAEKYVVPGTPTIYLIDSKGKISFSKVGRVGEDELEKAILDTLKR